MRRSKVLLVCFALVMLTACSAKKDDAAKVDGTTVNNGNQVEAGTKGDESKNVPNNKYKIALNEKAYDKKSTFYLGMTYKDALDKVNSLGFKEINTGDNFIKVMDGDTKVPVISIEFSSKDKVSSKLTKVYVESAEIPTTLGLKIGDPISKMEELYGRNYVLSVFTKTNITVYEYHMNKYIFNVEKLNDDKNIVNRWYLTVEE